VLFEKQILQLLKAAAAAAAAAKSNMKMLHIKVPPISFVLFVSFYQSGKSIALRNIHGTQCKRICSGTGAGSLTACRARRSGTLAAQQMIPST
jgi:hypothetical protein